MVLVITRVTFYVTSKTFHFLLIAWKLTDCYKEHASKKCKHFSWSSDKIKVIGVQKSWLYCLILGQNEKSTCINKTEKHIDFFNFLNLLICFLLNNYQYKCNVTWLLKKSSFYRLFCAHHALRHSHCSIHLALHQFLSCLIVCIVHIVPKTFPSKHRSYHGGV